MHARTDARTAENGIAAIEDGLPARSQLMDQALAAGAAIRSTLDDLARASLADGDRRRVDGWLGRTAAASAYGGMALWTLNALTVQDETAGRAAEAIAGLGVGALAAD